MIKYLLSIMLDEVIKFGSDLPINFYIVIFLLILGFLIIIAYNPINAILFFIMLVKVVGIRIIVLIVYIFSGNFDIVGYFDLINFGMELELIGGVFNPDIMVMDNTETLAYENNPSEKEEDSIDYRWPTGREGKEEEDEEYRKNVLVELERARARIEANRARAEASRHPMAGAEEAKARLGLSDDEPEAPYKYTMKPESEYPDPVRITKIFNLIKNIFEQILKAVNYLQPIVGRISNRWLIRLGFIILAFCWIFDPLKIDPWKIPFLDNFLENKIEEDKSEEDKPEEDKPEEDKPEEDKPEELTEREKNVLKVVSFVVIVSIIWLVGGG